MTKRQNYSTTSKNLCKISSLSQLIKKYKRGIRNMNLRDKRSQEKAKESLNYITGIPLLGLIIGFFVALLLINLEAKTLTVVLSLSMLGAAFWKAYRIKPRLAGSSIQLKSE
jgi:hypothetical protein